MGILGKGGSVGCIGKEHLWQRENLDLVCEEQACFRFAEGGHEV